MQHYANYRAQIRRMSEDTASLLPQDGNLDELSSVASVSSAIALPIPEVLGEEADASSKSNHHNPYKDYIHRRRRTYLIQFIVLLLLVAGFTVWMLTLIQRS